MPSSKDSRLLTRRRCVLLLVGVLSASMASPSATFSTGRGCVFLLLMGVLSASMASSSATIREDYGLVFRKVATASLTTKYFLQNLTVPIPAEALFRDPLTYCKEGVGLECGSDPFVSKVVDHVRAESGMYLHSEISRFLAEVTTDSPPFPVHLQPKFKFFTNDDLKLLNYTDMEIAGHKTKLLEEEETHWNSTLEGRTPVEQLPVLLQSVLLESMAARISWKEYARGFRQLLQGRLHPAVIPPGLVAEGMRNIYYRRSGLNTRFDLFNLDIGAYYRYSRVKAITLEKYFLTVTVAFPLDTIGSMLYDLYDVSTFPVLHQSDVILSSRVEGTPRFLAVARDGQTYAEADKWDKSSCEGPAYNMTCFVSLSQKPSSNPSCLLAVFQNNTAAARAKCRFHLQRERYVAPSARQVTPGLVLWTNASEISVTCLEFQSRVTTPYNLVTTSYNLPGCLQCLTPIPCLCCMRAGLIHFPRALSQCQNDVSRQIYKLENRGLMFRLQALQQHSSSEGGKQQAEEGAETGFVTEKEVDAILDLNPLGSFPLHVEEIKVIMNPWKPYDVGSYKFQAVAGLFFVITALFSVWLCYMEKKIQALKNAARRNEIPLQLSMETA